MEEKPTNTKTDERPPINRGGMVMMVALSLVLISVSVIAMKWRASLKVERIVLEGARTVSAKEVFAAMHVPESAPMFSVDLSEILERVLSQPIVRSAEVSRQFPDKLDIHILEREPVASINCGALRYVDADGVVLPDVGLLQKFDLPLISGIGGLQNMQAGKVVLNKEIFAALEICQTAQSLDTAISRMISEINMNSGGDIILYSVDGGVPIVLGRGGIERKLLTLAYFWNNFVATADVNKLKSIDLRFEDQVVVKWAGSQANEISS